MPKIQNFLTNYGTGTSSPDPYGLLHDRPASNAHKTILEYLLEPTLDQFFDNFGVLHPALITNKDESYEEQVRALQQQAETIWDEEQHEVGQQQSRVVLCHVEHVDHEVIKWSSDFFPTMRKLERRWELLTSDSN